MACGAETSQAPVAVDEDGRPNLVIVTLDTTRADHLGPWGYFRKTSPHFDELAAESILFENAWMPIATTLPTHLSLFTGTHPLEHGVVANTTHGGERFVPSPGLRSIAVFARDRGYHTAGVVGAAPLKRKSGIEDGFDHYVQPEDKHVDGAVSTDAALEWLGQLGAKRPFLLWVHYYDAHFPYEPAAEFDVFESDDALEAHLRERRFASRAPRELVGEVSETRPSLNAYDAELLYQDSLLGRLLGGLRALPDWDRTALLVVGDHGEGLGQHEEAAHGGIWQEQLHAPLLMRVPGQQARRVDGPLAAADVLPTFLSLARGLGNEDFDALVAAFAEQASGRDALAEGARARPILGQDTGRKLGVGRFPREDYRRSLTFRGFKLIRTDRVDGEREEALFDLGLDPFELTDVARRHPELVVDLSKRLDAEIERREERGRLLRGGGAVETTPVDPSELAELCALGYIECEDGVPIGAGDGSGD